MTKKVIICSNCKGYGAIEEGFDPIEPESWPAPPEGRPLIFCPTCKGSGRQIEKICTEYTAFKVGERP